MRLSSREADLHKVVARSPATDESSAAVGSAHCDAAHLSERHFLGLHSSNGLNRTHESDSSSHGYKAAIGCPASSIALLQALQGELCLGVTALGMSLATPPLLEGCADASNTRVPKRDVYRQASLLKTRLQHGQHKTHQIEAVQCSADNVHLC
jgi:hypothetical protein